MVLAKQDKWSLSSMPKDFNYLCQLNVEEWCKMSIYFYVFPKINSGRQGSKRLRCDTICNIVHPKTTLLPKPDILHDVVIKWKHFPRYWPFVRGIHRSPVNSPHKGQWRGTLMFSMICVCIYGWVNNRKAGDLRCHRTNYDVIVMDHWWGERSRAISSDILHNVFWCSKYVSKTLITTETLFKRSISFCLVITEPVLTHWGRVTHHCFRKWLVACSATTCAIDGLLSIRPKGTHYIEILFKIKKFSLRKMHWKMSSA